METAEAIGIDIGGTNVRAARVSADGAILERIVARTAPDGETLLGELVAMVGRLDGPRVCAVGIGVPGRVDAARAKVLSGGYINLAAVPLAPTLSARTGKPVILDNDCNMALVAEIAVGAGRGAANAVMFTIGTGIGGAIVVDGAIVRGRRTGGQLGHLTVERDGVPCACGRRGCVETTSSGTALARHLAEAGLAPETPTHELFAMLDAGSAPARRVIEAWARPLRCAIDSMVAAVDPDIVLLGGGLGAAATRALSHAPAVSPWYQCPVVAAGLGDDAGVIGGALAARSAADAARHDAPQAMAAR